MNDFEFRACDKSDISELYALELECFPDDAWSRDDFSESFKSSACKLYCMVFRQTQKIAAYGVMYEAADEGDLANIAVAPVFRRRGLGKDFLRKILDETRKNGISTVYLEVRESNTAAKKLYLSEGFSELGIRRKYYKNPTEDAIIMALVL